MLTFVIPTWNRAACLELAITSIADQIKEYKGQSNIKIIVSDNRSTDNTAAVLERLSSKYAFLRVLTKATTWGTDYSESFRCAFALADTEWTWTFGDDDMLMPYGLDTVLGLIKRGGFEFLHVAEVTRSRNSQALVKGKFIDLCRNIGWIDMCGFITGNIVKTEYWRQAVALPSWDLYAKNAFVQACALLEVLHDKDAAFYDAPIVDVQRREQTQEMSAGWIASNTAMRYHYVDEALVDMRARGILGSLTPKFFRYLHYHLWDRFLGSIIDSYNSTEDMKVTDHLDDLLRRCMNMTSFLVGADRKQYENEVIEVKQAMIEHAAALQYAIQKAGTLWQLMNDHARDKYEFSYLAPTNTKASPRAGPLPKL